MGRISSSLNSQTADVVSSTKSGTILRKSDPVKGSFEGLDKSSSAHIQMNGNGYDSKNIQVARYNKRIPNIDGVVKNTLTPFNSLRKGAIINNYSNRAVTNSSAFKMSTMLRGFNFIR